MFAVPDPDSPIRLPWKASVGWLALDFCMNGEEVAQGPRNTLRRIAAKAEAGVHRLKHGVDALCARPSGMRPAPPS